MAIFTPNPVIGIDISKYQYNVDVKALLDSGVKVFVVKIGQNSVLDSNFYKHANNVAKFASQGAILQCYYWDEITSSSSAQVTWLNSEINKSGLPITFTWIDAEQWWTNWSQYSSALKGQLPYSSVSRLTAANLSAHFYQTYLALKTALGTNKFGYYTNKSFVDEHATIPSGAPGVSMSAWMASEKVNMWIPYYGWQSQPKVSTAMTWNIWKQTWMPNYTPPIPAGTSYEQMKGHQSTGDVCKLPYIYSNIWNALSAADVNVFDGTWLTSLVGVTPPSAPIPQNRYVTIYNLNVYPTSAHLQPPSMGYIQINTEVIVYEVVGNYARVKDPVVNGVAQWVYFPYLKKVV
jgi:hypothetical protein